MILAVTEGLWTDHLTFLHPSLLHKFTVKINDINGLKKIKYKSDI